MSQVYISGNALSILGGPHDLIQTIYHEGSAVLDAVAIDEVSGRIAACTSEEAFVYRPYGWKEDALKVAQHPRELKVKLLTAPAVVTSMHATNSGRRARITNTVMGVFGGAPHRFFFAEAFSNRG